MAVFSGALQITIRIKNKKRGKRIDITISIIIINYITVA